MNLEKVDAGKPGIKTHMDLYFSALVAEIITQAKNCFPFTVFPCCISRGKHLIVFPQRKECSFGEKGRTSWGCLGNKEVAVSQIFFNALNFKYP